VSIDELDIRASQGGFQLVPSGLNETALAAVGLLFRRCDVRTKAPPHIATRLYAARQRRSPELTEMEGGQWFSQRQAFLATTAELAATKRLSRFLYIGEKPST